MTPQQVVERDFIASQWRLMWRKFRRHRMAIIGGSVLGLFYVLAIGGEFLTPYASDWRYPIAINHPPSRIHLFDGGRLTRPFVRGIVADRHPETLAAIYTEDEHRYDIRLFVSGEEYLLFGFIPTTIRLFGVDDPGALLLFGTDSIGQDVYSRSVIAARISLSIGLVGVAITFLIGVLLGGISGYFGGRVDTLIQRVIEFLLSIPTIPLWLALSAALPLHWSNLRIYFAIVIIVALIRWGGLARVVRGKLLELRERDFTLAARVGGMRELTIIRRHLLPNFASYLIVDLTLAVPGMILGETALSFLGLGLRDPSVSWGVLLQKAMNISSVASYPWQLIPALFVVITVMAFNFLGDGLRDAADPYK